MWKAKNVAIYLSCNLLNLFLHPRLFGHWEVCSVSPRSPRQICPLTPPEPISHQWCNTDRRGGNTHIQQEVYEKSFPNPAHSIVFQIMWLFIYCRILTENFNINPSSFTFWVMIVPEDCLEIPEETWLIGGSFFLTRFWQGSLWGQHCAFCTSGTRAACRSCTYCPVFILKKGKLGKYAFHRNRESALAPVGFVPPSTQR